jgi:type IV secretory pathway TraG/TraD family ATPase VirD4
MTGLETVFSSTTYLLATQVDNVVQDAGLIITIKNYGVPIAIVVVALLMIFGSGSTSHQVKKNRPKGNRPSRSTSNELGSGDLAPKEVILEWTRDNDDYDTKLPVEGLRGSDGVVLKKGYLVIPREQRNRHILVIAKTGSGKTTRMILPVLLSDSLSAHRSSIVIDSKPEMWDKLAGFTQKYCPHKRILLFNPLDTGRSLSWNILSKVEDDTDAKLIANTIIMATDNPSSKSDSPFFRNNALSLVNAIMVGLLSDKNELLSMPRVHELVHSGMKSLCDWLEAHPAAIRNCRTFVELARSGSQNADTIMSELGMRLAAWDLRDIRATTALDELDPEVLVQEPTLFIVELRESELEMLRPLANVVVVELLRFLTKRAESCPGHSLPIPVSLVIDEFASALGRLPDIHVKLNTLRSRNVSIVAAIQSIGQVKANYEKDGESVLSGFSTKIFMPALDFQDAEWASKETGTMTVRFNVASTGKNKRMIDYFAHQNENLQEQVQQRAVLTPDEIGRPADNISTFFLPNTPVFQGHLVPFYKVPTLLKMMDEGQREVVGLRTEPIPYEEHLPEPGPVSTAGAGGGGADGALGNIFNLSPEQLRESLEASKKELGFENTDPVAKEWWASFEEANAENLTAVVSLAQELLKRTVTIEEFYNIYASTGISDVTQILAAIDQHLYDELKKELGWDILSKHAKDWWIAFEGANEDNFPVVVELGKELRKRKVTIDDFFSAYVHSDFETIPEILGVIDQLISDGVLGENVNQASQAPAPVQENVSIDGEEDDDDLLGSLGISDDEDDDALFDEEPPPRKRAKVTKKRGRIRLEATETPSMSLSFEGEEAGESEDEDGLDFDVEDDNMDDIDFGDDLDDLDDDAAAGFDNKVLYQAPDAGQQIAQVAPAAQARPTNGKTVKETPPAAPEPEPVEVVSRATQAKRVAQNAALQSYIGMAKDLLKKGKVKDFDVLVGMAKDDKRFAPEDIEQLMQLKSDYEADGAS